MKRVLILLLLLSLLTGCQSTPTQTPGTSAAPGEPTEVTGPERETDLMPGASPQTSGLALYVYDGQTVKRSFLFDDAAETELLQMFHSAKVRPVALNTTELKAPYYGLEIGGADGFSVCGLWSEGYFIAGTGETYAFDYDFASLEQAYNWQNQDAFRDPAVLPCAYYAARTENGWNTGFLKPAEEPAGQKGISMELVSASAEQLEVRYVNHTMGDWSYGLDNELHVLVDDVWYRLPAQEDYGIISIAMLISPWQSRQQLYSLQPYGPLPDGTYRLVSNDLWTEFTIG